jgi:sugar phosphate isomerase/epimerase
MIRASCIVLFAMTILALWLTPLIAADDHKKINVGVQLYSLRAQFAKNGGATFKTIEKWGITDVEAAGFYDMPAEKFRDALEAHHLHASGAHFQWDRFSKDIDGIIKDAKTLGCEYVTLPWIPHNGDNFTEKDAKNAIEKFNEWGQKLADAGLKFTYHAHGYEFRPAEGGSGTLFDLMAKEAKPQWVNFELDVFWAYHGGADPVKLMETYPMRFPQMHLKDMKKTVKVPKYSGHEDTECDVALGTGQIDIAAILKQAEKIGVKHYYIEDESRNSELQIPTSVQYIRSVGF